VEEVGPLDGIIHLLRVRGALMTTFIFRWMAWGLAVEVYFMPLSTCI